MTYCKTIGLVWVVFFLSACQSAPPTSPADTFATALEEDVPFYDVLTATDRAIVAETHESMLATVLVATLTAMPPAESATPIPPTIVPTPTPYIPPVGFNPAQVGAVAVDVPYCRWEDEPVFMNVHYPTELSQRWPAVVVVHGGGWQTGGKGYGVANYFVEPLVNAGYLVVDIEYRLAPDNMFPAQINDVKCAIRHLRANADTYNLNPDAIGLLGFSSGGHLVALAGTADESAGFDVGDYLDQSSRVQVVVDISGVINLQWYCNEQSVRLVFGADGCGDDEVLYPANPVAYLTSDDPPVLIFHGDADTAVPIEISTYYQEKLEIKSVFNFLYVVQGAGHSYGLYDGDPAYPAYLNDMEAMMITFLDLFLGQMEQ